MSDPIVAPAVTTATPTPAIPAPAKGAETGKASEGTKAGETRIAEAPLELYEITINGKTEKLTLAELKKQASLGKTATQRFEEAARVRAQADSLLARLKNPKEAIKVLQDPALGLSKEAVQEAFEDWYHENVIEPGKLTPEQLKARDNEKRLKEFEERDAADKKKQEDKENEEKDLQTMKELQKEIMKILDDTGYTKSKFNMKRVAYWVRQNEVRGINATPELIVEQVKHENREIIHDETKNREGAALVEYLGEDVVKKIRAFDLQRLRANRQSLTPKDDTITDFRKKSDKTTHVSSRDVQDNYNKMLRGGKW